MKLPISEIQALAQRAFTHCGVSDLQTKPTIKALLLAESQGLASHGISRVPMYLAHVKHGRVDPKATPIIKKESASTALIDAKDGFAFPACELAVNCAMQKALQTGIGLGAVTNSHHFGVAGNHLLPLAAKGLIGLGFGNSPSAMPAWGGKHAAFGTNPIAALFPRQNKPPVLIDLSLSEVARGKIMVAAKENRPIPQGWALDQEGKPTTDAKAALSGMMLPMGGVKGAMLALMVEILVTSLTGAQFGAEADSFFVDAGNKPRLGQVFIAINPNALAGSDVYNERLAALLEFILQDPEVRIPGDRRVGLQAKAEKDGIDLPDALIDQIKNLCA